ncbi:MAG: siphovirus Gp157 family protein [Rhodospirillales bacterium]|nr:siphovirus Gp157 family protein [Rhodospirillales bacterium]
MSLALYKLADEYAAAADKLADPDLDPQTIADTLEGMAGAVEEKSTNVALFVRNLESTAEQIKAAEVELAKRRKAIENRAAHVRDYLLQNMIRCGISKIESPYLRLSVRDNPAAVEVFDASAVPAIFLRTPEPPPPAIDKAAIKYALKDGLDVPGCRLSVSQRLEIK